MTKHILVVLGHAEAAETCLEAAFDLAQRLNSPAITALHVRLDPKQFVLPGEEASPELHAEQIARHEADEAQTIKRTYDAWKARHGGELDARWLDITADVKDEIDALARSEDFIVVGQAPTFSMMKERKAIQAALFEAKRPLLVVPDGWRGSFDHVAVAWQPGAQVEEAVNLALPFLSRVPQVTVMLEDFEKESAEKTLVPVLDLANVKCDYSYLEVGSNDVATVILDKAREIGADLIVMGAYSHNRILETLFGGVTHDLLKMSGIPLLMLH